MRRKKMHGIPIMVPSNVATCRGYVVTLGGAFFGANAFSCEKGAHKGLKYPMVFLRVFGTKIPGQFNDQGE